MLTRLIRAAAVCVLAATFLGSGLIGWGLPAAVADECELQRIEHEDGRIEWIEVCNDDGGSDGGGDNGGGGGGEATCDTSVFDDSVHDGATRFCKGEIPCWGNFPSVFPEEEWEDLADAPRPGPDYIVTYVMCLVDGVEQGGWQWVIPPEDTGPSLWELAQMAYGNLETPDFDLTFNPPGRTLVSIDTWFWADGATDAEIIGESGGSVTAIAEPAALEVRTGDGRGPLECPFTVTESDACRHAYAQASVGKPDGYPAQMRLRYTVRFENNGAPLELDGLPTTLDSPWVEGGVPVAEVQTVVN